MKIELKHFTIREIVNGYKDESEEGVFGLEGKLNIRPPYQREFVYDDKKRNAVIETIRSGFPINVMYWVAREDGTYEVMDGQQRTLSFCQYYHGDYSIDNRYIFNLSEEERNQFLDYELFVYVCDGTTEEKLAWFNKINVAGEKLTAQELRNAVFVGTWLADAKRHFSKTACPAYKISSKYLSKSPIRQELLETAIRWISYGDIEGYMREHQNDDTCDELWDYFQAVFEWVEKMFVDYYPEMKNVEWGMLYNNYHNVIPEDWASDISDEVKQLMDDDDITNRKGIFEYVFDRNEKHLNLRTFRTNEKKAVYVKQGGNCPYCGEHFDFNDMVENLKTPWSEGGKVVIDNLEMVCKHCKEHKDDKTMA